MTSATVHIGAVLPRDTAKHLERGLHCSPRQAKRMAETGWIPGPLRCAAISLIKQEIARRRAELDDVEAQIKKLDHAAMVARVEVGQGRAGEAAGAATARTELAGSGAGLAEGSAHAALKRGA